MLEREVAVCHARDVIADGAFEAVFFDAGGGFASELGGVIEEEVVKFGDELGGLLVGVGDVRVVVEIGEKEAAEGGEFAAGVRAEGSEASGVLADVVEGMDARF